MKILKTDLQGSAGLNKKESKQPIENQKEDIRSQIPIKQKNSSIAVLLDSLLKELSLNIKTKKEVLIALKHLDISQNFKNTLDILKSIFEAMKNDKSLPKLNINLDEILLNIDKMDANKLKMALSKSGVFLESKLAKIPTSQPNQINIKKEILSDIKAVFLIFKKELSESSSQLHKSLAIKVDKILANIHYYQILTLCSNATAIYLPLLWEGLDEGKMSIKKLKKKRFFFEINLKLKRFGNIDILAILFDDSYINISFFAQDKEMLNLLNNHTKTLKSGINEAGLSVSNLYIYDYLKDDKIKKQTKEFAISSQMDDGINIHV